MSEYVSVEQVQEQLSVSRDTVDRLIDKGQIQAVKIGKCVRVSVESLEQYLKTHTLDKRAGETIA